MGTLANRQLASTKLSELAANLCFASSPKGSWLSAIRNAVNYQQRFATWFPYADQRTYYGQLSERLTEWKQDPEGIDLVSHDGKDLRRFQSTCNFIIALCHATIFDMKARCSAGDSFHTYRSLAFLNLLHKPPARSRR